METQEFGELLRAYRKKVRDPNGGGKLTQARFAELLSTISTLQQTSTDISRWETGKRQIKADDRVLLIGLIETLSHCGGIETLAEANQLLLVRGARALDRDEIEKIKSDWWEEKSAESPPPPPSSIPAHIQSNPASRLVWAITQPLTQLTYWHALLVCVALITIFLADQLLTPILNWPSLDDERTRGIACIKLAVAAFVLPLPAALLPQFEQRPALTPLARFTSQSGGACLGINLLLLILVTFIIPLLGNMRLLPLKPSIGWGLFAVLFLSSYLLSQYFVHVRTPPDHHAIVSKTPDLILWAFPFATAILGAFIYMGYETWIRPNTSFAFLLALATLFLWHLWRNGTINWSHRQAMTIMIVLILTTIIIGTLPDPEEIDQQMILITLIMLTFAMAPIIIAMLLQPKLVEQPPPYVIVGAPVTLTVLLLLMAIPQLVIWSVITLAWVAWLWLGAAHTWQRYLWLHPCYLAIILATGFALNAILRQHFPFIIVWLGYTLVAIPLIWWATRAAPRR